MRGSLSHVSSQMPSDIKIKTKTVHEGKRVGEVWLYGIDNPCAATLSGLTIAQRCFSSLGYSGISQVHKLAAHAQPRRALQPHVRGVGHRRALRHLAAHHVRGARGAWALFVAAWLSWLCPLSQQKFELLLQCGLHALPHLHCCRRAPREWLLLCSCGYRQPMSMPCCASCLSCRAPAMIAARHVNHVCRRCFASDAAGFSGASHVAETGPLRVG